MHKSVSSEQGFTLVELMIVIIIIGIMLGSAVIAFAVSMGNADVRGSSEMIKQDLRRVYALASAGNKPAGIEYEDYRYRYRITFQGNTGSPKNSYIVYQGVPDTLGNYDYDNHPMTPKNSATNKTSGNSIIPSSNVGTRIEYSSQHIYFVSFGAITVANAGGEVSPGNEMTVSIKNGSTTKTVTISGYGNISE